MEIIMPVTENSLRQTITNADDIVVRTMQGYLRICRAGGMPKELSDKIEAHVRAAADFQSFSVALAEAAGCGS
jgi:hypothetical protein